MFVGCWYVYVLLVHTRLSPQYYIALRFALRIITRHAFAVLMPFITGN